MHPHLFGSTPAYPAMLFLGLLAGAAFGGYCLWRSGISPRNCLRLQLVLALAGLAGAKLYSVWERGGIGSFPEELIEGYRYPGGIIAAAVALGWVMRRWPPLVFSPAARIGRRGEGTEAGSATLALLGDALAPSAGFAVAVVRIGCFLEGCCFGTVSQLPWAIRFPAGSPAWDAHISEAKLSVAAEASLAVHPLQLYFALLSLGAALLALWLQPRKTFDGQVVLAFLAIDGLGQLALEGLRHTPEPHLQVAALVTGGSAAALAFVGSLRARRNHHVPLASTPPECP